MTKIITCSELRYRTLEQLKALFRTRQIELGRRRCSHRARFARTRHCARQPRKRPAGHGGAPYPASEAVSAGAWVRGLKAAGNTRGFQVFEVAECSVRSEARCFRAVRHARSGRDWRPPRSSACRRSLRCYSNCAA